MSLKIFTSPFFLSYNFILFIEYNFRIFKKPFVSKKWFSKVSISLGTSFWKWQFAYLEFSPGIEQSRISFQKDLSHLHLKVFSASFHSLKLKCGIQRIGVIHLWRSQKITNFLTPYPHYPQKWTIDLLFKNNRIRKYVTNFKNPPPPFRVDVINAWSHIWIKFTKFLLTYLILKLAYQLQIFSHEATFSVW